MCRDFPRLLLCNMNGGVDLTSGKRFTEDYGTFVGDFAGEDGVRIQQLLIDGAPKYGNDDYVDSLAVEWIKEPSLPFRARWNSKPGSMFHQEGCYDGTSQWDEPPEATTCFPEDKDEP